MKILVFADGANIHTELWLHGMDLAGMNDVYLLNMNPAGIRDGIKARLSPDRNYSICPDEVSPTGSNWSYLLNVFQIKRLVQKLAPDVIIANYLTSYGLMAALVKGNAFLVHHMMGSDVMVTPNRGWHYYLATLFALRRANMLVSVSQTMHDRLQEIYPLDPGSVLVQQYGLDDWILDFPEQEKSYTFVSNRAWIKNSNIPLVLDLFSFSDPNTTLALVGWAVDQTEDIQPATLKNSRITFLEYLPHEGMVDVVARSDFFFSLTSSDGTSLSLLEAMAVGSIPIVSDISPNREWVIDGVNGFLIDLHDIEGARQQIKRAMSLSEKKRNEMRLVNKVLVKEKGSCSKNMKRFSEQLESLYVNRKVANGGL
jgi:glycosyltransferase involved in cell wall biosynthesis